MSKIRMALVASALTAFVPVAAFAAHASHCCGSIMCCLRHLGCC
ncbi:MAG TPA: hypothetical protein VIA18_00895 [Polyangia bacterium]|jgi:hypothetical protein|nr:hypothetical protein [Polyangia bacterium]